MRFFGGGVSVTGLRSSVAEPNRRMPGSLVVHVAADYYDTLGVPRGADKKTIKNSYRQKARKYHPDVNKSPGAEEEFKKISEAYEVLSDDQKRQIYDQYGEAGLKSGMGGFSAAGPGDFTNPFDLFEQFFGGGMGATGFGGRARTASRAVAGDDLRVDVELSFLEAVFGCAKDIEINHLTECKTCSGSGVKAGTSSTKCSQCQGQGQVVSAMNTPLGVFQQVATCPRCQGTGETFASCEVCGGDGRLQDRKKIQVQVPAGIDNGSRLRVRGEGNAGIRGGPPGDLYVFTNVRSHPKMKRDGTTIYSDVEISYLDAILGTSVKVTTVDGDVELKIPGGTQPETTLLMSKRGVPKLGSSTERGNHKVRVRVKIPKNLSGDERKLVEKLRELDESTFRVGPFKI